MCREQDSLSLMHGTAACVDSGYNNGAQRREQFLPVGRLYRALILLGLVLCFPSASMFLVFMVLYVFIANLRYDTQ